MSPETKRPLKVFLCHASGDKPPVRDLYKRLTTEGVDAWLDKEKLLPGQDWQVEIPRAVHEADVVVVCLSNKSITKEGYVQKEIKFALDIAEEKPEGAIFLIPARLEDCIVPERLSRWQWVDLYEENGFTQLLRSLKLRANAVGAVIEAVSYEDTDKERERRLSQLYTEGLEAFYTEDWDRACRCLQAILSEQPNHKNAAEKLEEAQCQGHYAKLYTQATEAYQSENWVVAIPALEELSQKAPNYKDAAQLLRDARKREHLTELYTEAKVLYSAQKWQAVVKVFDQIAVIEPNYPDSDQLLASAQKEVAELERLEELNEQYSQALREMDLGNWHEARRLLESVHKSQTGFMETEKLLRKVENKILKEQEKRQQNEQINILYEQAHGLFRSQKWRNALDKLEEIRRLDEHFLDADGIAEKVQKELEREELAAQRQNELAAMYAESVRMLKEEKYQEALDKLQEVKALDSKYPDRQRVQSIARRRLTELGEPIRNRPRLARATLIWIGIIGFIVIGLVANAIVLSRRDNQETSIGTMPSTATGVASSSATIPPAVIADLTRYDDFNDPLYNGRYNNALWDTASNGGKIVQGNGLLTFELNASGAIALLAQTPYKLTYPIFIESKMMLDSASTEWAGIQITFQKWKKGDTWCGIFESRSGEDKQELNCGSELELPEIPPEPYSASITPGVWHLLRIELYPDSMTFVFFVDGNKIGAYTPQKPDTLKDLSYTPAVFLYSGTNSAPRAIGYVDYVEIGKIEE